MILTKKEALKSTVNFPLPDQLIEKVLIDQSLDGEAPYTKADVRDIDLAMAGLLFSLLTSADQTEGDWTVKLPQRDVLLKVYSSLCIKWNMPDLLAVPKPRVRRVYAW
jgi:hypothetical protein